MYSLADISKILKKRTEQDEMIIKARVSGKSFCELSDLEKRVAVDQMMFNAAAISGCGLPQTEMFASIIAEQICLYLTEFGHDVFTEAEFLLALQLNAHGRIKNPAGEDLTQVTFIGNQINVSFLAKIFNNYATIRNNLDGMIKNKIDGY